MDRHKAHHIEDRTTLAVTMLALLPLGLVVLGAIMLVIALGW
jgi:hypothetical protein